VNVFVLNRRKQIDAQKTKENGKENKSIFFFFVAGFEGKKKFTADTGKSKDYKQVKIIQIKRRHCLADLCVWCG
jgi:uncharacterized protein YggU (UPF0235/DUF167 family)